MEKQKVNMIEFIPSKDVRDYIIETGRQFTDFEKAALLYHLELSFYERQEQLQKIAETTDDSNLKEQILERIEMDTTCIDMFTKCNQGFVYAVVRYRYDEPDICGYFGSVDLAYKHGMKQGCRFDIDKFQIVGFSDSEIILPKGYWNPYLSPSKEFAECVDEMEYDGDAIATLSYDKGGILLDYYSQELRSSDDELLYHFFSPMRFENAYVDIPNPFEKGDRVKVVTTGEQGIVVTSQQQWEMFSEKVMLGTLYDFFDVCITVDFEEDGQCNREHICHLFLERCE